MILLENDIFVYAYDRAGFQMIPEMRFFLTHWDSFWLVIIIFLIKGILSSLSPLPTQFHHHGPKVYGMNTPGEIFPTDNWQVTISRLVSNHIFPKKVTGWIDLQNLSQFSNVINVILDTQSIQIKANNHHAQEFRLWSGHISGFWINLVTREIILKAIFLLGFSARSSPVYVGPGWWRM